MDTGKLKGKVKCLNRNENAFKKGYQEGYSAAINRVIDTDYGATVA